MRPDDLLLVVRVPNVVLLAPNPFTWLSDRTPPAGLPKAQRHALAAMRHGTAWSNKSLREAYPIDCRQATTVLAGLVSASLAEAVGAGSTRAYRLARPQPPNTPAPAGRSTKSPTHPQRLYTSRQDDARALLATLAQEGPATLAELSVKCGLTARQVKYAVQLLREDGRVELHGGRGSRSLYSARLGPLPTSRGALRTERHDRAIRPARPPPAFIAPHRSRRPHPRRLLPPELSAGTTPQLFKYGKNPPYCRLPFPMGDSYPARPFSDDLLSRYHLNTLWGS